MDVTFFPKLGAAKMRIRQGGCFVLPHICSSESHTTKCCFAMEFPLKRGEFSFSSCVYPFMLTLITVCIPHSFTYFSLAARKPDMHPRFTVKRTWNTWAWLLIEVMLALLPGDDKLREAAVLRFCWTFQIWCVLKSVNGGYGGMRYLLQVQPGALPKSEQEIRAEL